MLHPASGLLVIRSILLTWGKHVLEMSLQVLHLGAMRPALEAMDEQDPQ